MANVDAPYGLRPIYTLDSSPIRNRSYPIDASGATIGVGDLMVLEADGNVTSAAASPTDGTVIGVAASPHTTGTAGTVLVWDNPSIVFSAQCDDGSTAGGGSTAAGVGANFNITDTAPSNGISQQEVDEDSDATTATLPFKSLGRLKITGNDYGEFCQILVTINNHALRGGTGTGVTV